MIAASMGYSNCVKTLLFETGLRNTAKETALIISIKCKHDACVDILLPHEGEYPDSRGENALFWAIRNNDLVYIDKLIGYLKKRRSAQGKTALMLAVELHNIPAVQKLIPHEARLCDSKNRSALMYAAELGDASLVALLAEHEAGMLDVYGRTALMRAMKHGYTECFNILLSHEALVRSNKGLSVLDLCLKWSLEGTSDFEDADDEAFSISEPDCDSTGSSGAIRSNSHYNEVAASKIRLMDNEYIATSTPHLPLKPDDSVDDDDLNMAPFMHNISFTSNLTPNSEVLSFTTDSSAGMDIQLCVTDLSFTSDQLHALSHQTSSSLNPDTTSSATLTFGASDANVLLTPTHMHSSTRGATVLSRATLSNLPDATQPDPQYSTLPPLPSHTPTTPAKQPVMRSKESERQATTVSSKSQSTNVASKTNGKQSWLKHKVKSIGTKLSLLGREEKPAEHIEKEPDASPASTKKTSALHIPRHQRSSMYVSSDSESENDIGLGIIAIESETPTLHKAGRYPLTLKSTAKESVASFSESSTLVRIPSSHASVEAIERDGVKSGGINSFGSKPISRIYSISRLSKANKDDIEDYKAHITLYLETTSQHLVLTPRAPTLLSAERTMLMEYAAKGDAIGVQQHLNEMGAMCTSDGDSSGATALMLAVIEGNVNVMPYLLNELGIVNKKGYTALLYAAQDGLEEGIPLLLPEAGMRSQTGRTALIQAAAFGHTPILSYLIPWEAGIYTNKSQTALMRAAQNGHFRCVEILKESSKEVKQVDKDGRTALWKAASDGHIECTAMLAPLESKIAAKDGTTALIMAAERGHTMCVRLLTTWEAKLTDKTHTTALMYAARAGNIECVRILAPLEQRMRRVDGTTALIVSIRARKPDCTKLLLAEANMRSGAGETVLAIAKQMNSMACYQVILNAKV